ncbi:MAG: sugar phosphate isomerase/epimerase [Synergistaceae bacterium]|jgi:sugar phosphate isomerase/epimerase|nr:sugar phosphate isomerase/epimerase [Synergistaceae bacterium]
MKLGIYTNARKDLSFEEFLDYAKDLGAEMVELGCGEESGFAHCDPEVLLNDEAAFARYAEALSRRRLRVSALSCHGNPVAADPSLAAFSDRCMRNAVLLAEKMRLDTINCFSGCPGSGASRLANWVTVGWPMDYPQLYRWQWNEVLVPYWKDFAAFARAHGILHVALEMHPGQMCYNPKTVKRLRAEAGDNIGVNLDFSHLLWQRMEPDLVIEELRGMIWHMHVKDIAFQERQVRENGLINFHYFDESEKRPWNFRCIGYGHDLGWWGRVFAALRRGGYDYVASVEYECEITSADFGIRSSLERLASILPRDSLGDPGFWRDRAAAQRNLLDQKYGVGEER